jgi:hypothetical protein
MFARPSYAVVPVGLREALLVIGDGEIDPAQGTRLIGLLEDAALRQEGHGPRLVPTLAFAGRARWRFAELDLGRRSAAGARQPWLFTDAPPTVAPGELGTRPYSAGLTLSPARGFADGAAEGDVARALPCGSWSPSYADGTDRLAAWRSFEARRNAPSPYERPLFPNEAQASPPEPNAPALSVDAPAPESP